MHGSRLQSVASGKAEPCRASLLRSGRSRGLWASLVWVLGMGRGDGRGKREGDGGLLWMLLGEYF